jgi:hypothetical protein
LKKLAFVGSAIGVGLAALLLATTSHAADHLDAPSVMNNPMADITDVYAWMSPDDTNVNLVMDVSPADDGSNNFGPSILYTFHVTSWTGYGGTSTASPETRVTCQFADNTSVQCWVGSSFYVTGDPTNTTNFLTDSTQTFQVFAGQRSDPFFFNFNGFKDWAGSAAGFITNNTFTYDNSGVCLKLDDATGTAMRGKLSEGPQGGGGHAPCNGTGTDGTGTTADCFANLNVMSIVIQIKKSALNVGSNSVLSVWGSTNTPG